MAAEVALEILGHDRLVAVDAHRDRPLHLADERVAALDAAVEDADADTGPRGASERPFAGDAVGPRDRRAQLLEGICAQAPSGKRLGLAHASDRKPSSASTGTTASSPSRR